MEELRIKDRGLVTTISALHSAKMKQARGLYYTLPSAEGAEPVDFDPYMYNDHVPDRAAIKSFRLSSHTRYHAMYEGAMGSLGGTCWHVLHVA